MVTELVPGNRLDGYLASISEPRDAAQLARDFAALARVKGRDANRELVAYAKAARRCGELLLPENLPRERGTAAGRNRSSDGLTSYQEALADCLIDHDTANKWQRLARIDAIEFAEWCTRVEAGEKDAAIRALLEDDKSAKLPKPVPAPESHELAPLALLRFCQPDLPTATVVTLILRVAFPDAETALDTTYGNGSFWDGTAHVAVTAIDVDPTRAPDGAIDFRALPYGEGAFDVVLFDPPHLADAGAESIMRARFGTFSGTELKAAIWDGCQEIWRVARLGVVVKVTDHVHGMQLVSESDWVKTAMPAPVYEIVHQTRSGALVDPKWEEQLSAHNNGSTYLIFRKDSPLHVRRNTRGAPA